MSDMVPASQAGVSRGLERASSHQPRARGLAKRVGKQMQKVQAENGIAAFRAELRHGLDRQKLQHEEERGRIRLRGASEIAFDAHDANRKLSIEEARTIATVFDDGRSVEINDLWMRTAAGILVDYRDRTA